MLNPLEKIDSALGLMKDFSKVSCGTAAAIQRMRQEAIFTDGQIPARLKALAATLWAVSARCEPCIKYYVQQAARLGATEEELGEFLAVASTMGGCVGEMWALKAYAAYKQEPAGEASCCSSP
jgi:AhpD family alkylhydroperoxidase